LACIVSVYLLSYFKTYTQPDEGDGDDTAVFMFTCLQSLPLSVKEGKKAEEYSVK
jgi:hypothetical protein